MIEFPAKSDFRKLQAVFTPAYEYHAREHLNPYGHLAITDKKPGPNAVSALEGFHCIPDFWTCLEGETFVDSSCAVQKFLTQLLFTS